MEEELRGKENNNNNNQNYQLNVNHINSKERYIKEWDMSKELQLKSNKNIELASESSKCIYNIINEPNSEELMEPVRKKKGYINGKGN